MLPILLILTLCPRINCEIEEDSPPDAVCIRSPRQVNTLLRKVSKPQMLELSVQTTIMSSYAFTAVSCTLINRHWAATPGHFLFHVPSAAFITNFTMIVGGRVFPSQAKAKEKMLMKKVSSDKTKKKSPSQSEGEMEVFEVTVLIPEWSRAMFLLSYEELLQRRLGRYEHVTRIQPMQLVSKLSVGVTIMEHKRIIHLEVFPLRKRKGSLSAWNGKVNGNAGPPHPTTIRQNETICRISFTPNIAQQVKISTYGMLGDFIVQYDVERQMGIGHIQVLDGHFVHYFAPKDLPVVPKNVVFVIDTSASMIGTKIRQTKEALFTILHELRPNDHFNFVTFSNRIRVWQPGRLMPVFPNNIRDAKKFIYIITPSGGTDINAGIQAGSALLSDFLSSKDAANRNSVSFIIFLTDGRPTIGVTQSPTIISNTKTAIQEKFCLFTVGLGEDVDYKLLKIMSLQNCGAMKRIPEDGDTSIMLSRFYHEIGTPLLSNIQVEYSDDAVEYVTQNLFVNYFNGSELVIAGRLTNRSADSLHIQVSASNGERRIVLEKDMSIHEREQDTQQRLAKAEPDVKRYVERLWGYLSTKDELKERLQSQIRSERETHIQRATNLSLTYGFLTPLTHLIVEKPLLLENGTVGNAVPKSGSSNQLPEDNGSLTTQKSVSARPSSTSSFSKPAKKSVVLSKTSADGDPHFVVDLPLSKLTVCFNINGKPGHVIRLLTDHRHSGVTVNAALIGAPSPEGSHKTQRTYFSSITIVADKPRRSYIEVNPQKIILDGLDRMILPVTSSISVESQNLAVVLIANTSLTVTIGRSMEFLILFHHYKNPAPYQRDHLGFYIANGEGLSGNTHGLLGQFLHQEIQLMEYPGDMSKTGGKWEAQGKNISALKVKDRTVPVMKKRRRIHFGKRTLDCWFARNNGAKLIEGHYKDYVVPHAFDTGDCFHGSNTA